jgi:hypothetical protein
MSSKWSVSFRFFAKILHAVCLAYSSKMKMEIVFCFETLLNFYQTTWHYSPEDKLSILTPFINNKHVCMNCFLFDYNKLNRDRTVNVTG